MTLSIIFILGEQKQIFKMQQSVVEVGNDPQLANAGFFVIKPY